MDKLILGFIVSTKKERGLKWFVEQVPSVTDVPHGYPYLVIGYSLAKKQEGFVSTMVRSLGKYGFWTYSKTEKKAAHDDDLDRFYDYIVKTPIERVKYFYVSPFKISFKKIKKLLSMVQDASKKCIYISSGMAYIYFQGKDYVLGVSFDDLDYIGISQERIMRIIDSGNENTDIYYQNDSIVKQLANAVKYKRYTIPYLISKYRVLDAKSKEANANRFVCKEE